MALNLSEIQEDARMVVQTTQELFLRLCAINYLNALVKQERIKTITNQHKVDISKGVWSYGGGVRVGECCF